MRDALFGKDKTTVAVSLVAGASVVETIYRPRSATTAFAAKTGTLIEIVPEWKTGDVTYVPVRPSNNLLRHGALILPSEPTAYGTREELLAEIEQYIERYVALPRHAVVVSAGYVLLTWLYDVFNELPYLRFRGDYGTGKTRALSVIGSICYKAFFASGASTISPIFHTLDTFKGALVFDEADFRFSDEKAELVKILNNGNARGFPVLRTHVSTTKEFDPRAFAIYGPKVVGMRRTYEDRALESRFLTIEMEPGRSAGVPINLPESQKDEALALRNKLLMFRLRNRLSAKLDPELADKALEARMNQILLPLLSVLPDPERRAVILETATALHTTLVSERSGSSEGLVLSVLARLHAQPRDGALSLGEIADAFRQEFASEYERPITNRWVGSTLRRLGIALYKSNGVFVVLPGQDDRVQALCDRYGIERPGSTGPLDGIEQS